MSSIVDPRRATRLPPMNNRFLDSSSDEEEDEETRLLREEEEQERLLSEQHGEAEESSAKRKSEEKEDIEAEYGNATRKKARRRPTLTPAMMTSSKGLIRIRSEFPRQVKFPKKKSKTEAAAVYSRTLVNAYKSFCYDLFPTNAFEDVLTRMETFGAKKEVKEYLTHMREDVRNGHLETIYGKEKAATMIAELEHGLKQQQQDEFGVDAMDDDILQEGSREYELRRGPFRGPTPQEESGATGGENTTTATSTSNVANTTDSRAVETSNTATTATTVATTAVNQEKATQDDLQDTDDELEFVASTEPKPVNPFADDDDDDDDEEFGNEKTANGDKNVETQEKGEEAPGMDVDKTEEEPVDTTSAEDKTTEEEEEEAVGESGKENGAIVEGAMSTDNKGDESGGMQGMETTLDENTSSPVFPESKPSSTDEQELEESLSPDKAAAAVQETQEDKESVDVAAEEESLSAPTQEQEQEPSSSDETATIVPTMTESQFDDIATQDVAEDSQYFATKPLVPESHSTPTDEQEASSSSDETATVVPTMETQTESPRDDDEGEAAASTQMEQEVEYQ